MTVEVSWERNKYTVTITIYKKARRDKLASNTAYRMFRQLKARTPIDTGAARRAWRLNAKNREIIIYNNIAYIAELDRGHSKQAPLPLGIVKFVFRQNANNITIVRRRGVRSKLLRAIFNTFGEAG